MTDISTSATPNRRATVSVRTVIVLCIALALLSGGIIASVAIAAADDDGPTPLPASYYGTVEINGDPAPAGITIEAEIDNSVRGSITIDTEGEYGGPTVGEEKLVINGTAQDDGEPVMFYVRGEGLDRTEAETQPDDVVWEAGDIKEVNITVDVDLDNGVSDDEPSESESTDDQQSEADDTTDDEGEENDTNIDDSTSADDATEDDESADDATDDEMDTNETVGTNTTETADGTIGEEGSDDETITEASDDLSTDDSTTDSSGDHVATEDTVSGFGTLLTLSAVTVAGGVATRLSNSA